MRVLVALSWQRGTPKTSKSNNMSLNSLTGHRSKKIVQLFVSIDSSCEFEEGESPPPLPAAFI